MLTEQQLEKNKNFFLKTNEKYGIMTESLLDFLGEDFYIAPASTSSHMVGAYPGGLLQHLIRACKYAINVNDVMPENLKQDVSTIVKCTFLSQIGKVFSYVMNSDEWSIKHGKMYDYRDDTVRLRIGERSVYYALTYGVSLCETEFQSIVNMDKDSEDKMSQYYSEPLTYILKYGFEIATMEEKNNG